jgi:peptidylprolyl isomerase
MRTKSVKIIKILSMPLIFAFGIGIILLNTNTVNAEMIKHPSGLIYDEVMAGTGEEAVSGRIAVVHYTGWLDNDSKKGTKFDSSVDRGQSFSFPLGTGAVIKGWDEGVKGMKVGSKRTLYIPSELGYGQRGAGGVIPPGADLIFDVELLELK